MPLYRLHNNRSVYYLDCPELMKFVWRQVFLTAIRTMSVVFPVRFRLFGGLVACRLGRWTRDRKVVGSSQGHVAINWLLLGWVTVCGQVNHLGI